jgi:hypothetical protein
MHTWPRRIFVAATLVAAGCNGSIEDPGTGTGTPGTGTGTPGTGTGTPGTGTGTPGTGTGTPGTGTGTPGATPGTGTGTPGTGTGTPGTGTGMPGTGTTPCTAGVPATSQLPRLTHLQYDNTIRDLVGISGNPSSQLAPDGVGSVDQRAWDGYQAAATAVATQVMANAAARSMAIPCTPSGDGSACAKQLVDSFGQRAFRRPLTADESARFLSLYTNRATITANGTFDEAAELIIRSFLQSPSFLTRAEISETADATGIALNSWEMASRLSYLLWQSMPDAALFTKAAANGLATAEGVLGEATRMLADPKARAAIGAFHESYLLMGPATRWTEGTHDTKVFPAFKASLVPTLSDEAKRFFDYITFDLKGSFQDLITRPVAFVNKDLAPFYGLDAGKFTADLALTDLDPAQRAGAFTHAGFLASYSSFNRTSPILRGAFLQKQVLCTAIGAPPADALNTPVPTDASLVTNRQRVDQQTSPDACKGCHHTLVNPTGFALEAYDGIGAWQTKERDTGAAIDTKATVVIGSSQVEVTGPVDLMAKIAASPEAKACYASKWVKYAYERELTSPDNCTVQNIATKMNTAGYTVLNLITDLTQAVSFRYRAKEAP